MHDFQEQCQVHGQQCPVRGQRSKNGFYNKKIRIACIIKQLLDSVIVISGIIKVSVSVISRSRTLTSTLIFPYITKTSSNSCLLLHYPLDSAIHLQTTGPSKITSWKYSTWEPCACEIEKNFPDIRLNGTRPSSWIRIH